MKRNLVTKIGALALSATLLTGLMTNTVSAARISGNLTFGSTPAKYVIDVSKTSVSAEISTSTTQLLYAQAIGTYTYGGKTYTCENSTSKTSSMIGCSTPTDHNGYYFAEGRGRYRVSSYAYQYSGWKTPSSTN